MNRLKSLILVLTLFFTGCTLMSSVPQTPIPSRIDVELTQVAGRADSDRAYLNVGFEVVKNQMPIEGVESKLLGGTGDRKSYWFKYQYVTTNFPFDLNQRVPYLLCGFQQAGLTGQFVEFTVEQNSKDNPPYQGSYYCVAPEDIQALNCNVPGEMNLRTIKVAKDCPRNGG